MITPTDHSFVLRNPVVPVVWFIASFLVGSIPFGYLVGRFVYRTDIRKAGSGNIGAMNALRTLGKSGAVVVLLLDALKGFVPVWYVQHLLTLHLPSGVMLSPAAAIVVAGVATCAVVAHCFSPWLRFRGGKGVATSFGVIFALSWPAGCVVIGAWLLGALVTRYSSVGSMLAHVVAPFAIGAFTHQPAFVCYTVLAMLLIMLRHRENIARLRAGSENRIRLTRERT